MHPTPSSTESKPEIPQFENFATELTKLDQWVGSAENKKPLDVNLNPKFADKGSYAKSNDPETWATFEQARSAYNADGGLCHVGFVFTDKDTFAAIDLDHCIDANGKLHPEARVIVNAVDSYTEISPSGDGLKIFVDDPIGWHGEGGDAEKSPKTYDVPWKELHKSAQLEIWSHGKYSTVTGNIFEGRATITEKRTILKTIHKRYFKKKPATVARASSNGKHNGLTEDKKIERLCDRIPKFRGAFYDGVREGPSESEDDLRMAGWVARITDDPDEIETIMRRSKYERDKWDDNKKYLTTTIEKARSDSKGPDLVKDTKEQRELDNWIIPAKEIEPPKGAGASFNDAGNASRFVAQWIGQVFWCIQLAAWFWWDDTRWKFDENNAVVEGYAAQTIASIETEALSLAQADKLAGMRVLRHALKSGDGLHLETMLKRARRFEGMSHNLDELDRNPWLLNLPDKTLDLRLESFGLRDHNAADLITMLCPVNYVEGAQDDLVDEFYNGLTGGNDEYKKFIFRAYGLSLTGDTSEDIGFLPHGLARTGKTTGTRLMCETLGDYGLETRPETFLKSRGDGDARSYIREFPKKRMVIAVEIPAGKELDTSLINRVAGGDKIQARGQHELKPLTFTPECKLWLVSNHNLDIPDTEQGTPERLLKLPFNNRPEKIDTSIRDKLLDPNNTSAREALLFAAVEGCKEWQKLKAKKILKLDPPACVTEATEDYFEDQSPVSEFVQIFLEPIDGGALFVSDLWDVYNKWMDSKRYKSTIHRKSALMDAIKTQKKFRRIHNYNNNVMRMDGIQETVRLTKGNEKKSTEVGKVRVGLYWSKTGQDWIGERVAIF